MSRCIRSFDSIIAFQRLPNSFATEYTQEQTFFEGGANSQSGPKAVILAPTVQSKFRPTNLEDDRGMCGSSHEDFLHRNVLLFSFERT